jgi:hypothetical protein
MSRADTMIPLLQTPWRDHDGERLPVTPLPPLAGETIERLNLQWTGTLTGEMRKLLQRSCGISGTPLGSIDFTGCWYPEEPLSIFRPSITLAIDDEGRRWIAEVGRKRGLPGPVWCVFPRPEVAMFVDRSLVDFLIRLHSRIRRNSLSQWFDSLHSGARTLWATRHARAIAVPVAFTRLRELRGWLAELPVNAWVYDLRSPGRRRGLPYGLAHERGGWYRCGRLPVFALVRPVVPPASVSTRDLEIGLSAAVSGPAYGEGPRAQAPFSACRSNCSRMSSSNLSTMARLTQSGLNPARMNNWSAVSCTEMPSLNFS